MGNQSVEVTGKRLELLKERIGISILLNA